MNHYYGRLPPVSTAPRYQSGNEFGQFEFIKALGGGGTERQQREGMPLGKITLDTTPELTQRMDRLLVVTERIATEAATTSQIAIGVALLLGFGAIGAAFYKASRPTHYGND
jgi:hypothetical protein